MKYGGLKNVIQFVYDGWVEIPNFEEFVDFADTFSILQINLGPKIAKTVKNIVLNNSDSETMQSSQEVQFKCENCQKKLPNKETADKTRAWSSWQTGPKKSETNFFLWTMWNQIHGIYTFKPIELTL